MAHTNMKKSIFEKIHSGFLVIDFRRVGTSLKTSNTDLVHFYDIITAANEGTTIPLRGPPLRGPEL